MVTVQTKFQEQQRVVIVDPEDPDYNHEAIVTEIDIAPDGNTLYTLKVETDEPDAPIRFLRDYHLRAV